MNNLCTPLHTFIIQTILGNGGADYIEGRVGDDALFGGGHAGRSGGSSAQRPKLRAPSVPSGKHRG